MHKYAQSKGKTIFYRIYGEQIHRWKCQAEAALFIHMYNSLKRLFSKRKRPWSDYSKVLSVPTFRWLQRRWNTNSRDTSKLISEFLLQTHFWLHNALSLMTVYWSQLWSRYVPHSGEKKQGLSYIVIFSFVYIRRKAQLATIKTRFSLYVNGYTWKGSNTAIFRQFCFRTYKESTLKGKNLLQYEIILIFKTT